MSKGEILEAAKKLEQDINEAKTTKPDNVKEALLACCMNISMEVFQGLAKESEIAPDSKLCLDEIKKIYNFWADQNEIPNNLKVKATHERALVGKMEEVPEFIREKLKI